MINRKFSTTMKNEKSFLEAIEKFQKKVNIIIVNREVHGKFVDYEISIEEPYKFSGYIFLGMLNTKDSPVLISESGKELFKKVDTEMNFKCESCNKSISNRQNKYFFEKN